MRNETTHFQEAVEYIKSRIERDFRPQTSDLREFKPVCAIILGTGLGGLADEVADKIEIPYEEIPGFVKSTAPSHRGTLIAGYLNSRAPHTAHRIPIIVFRGRFHYYEGYSMQQVVFPVRVARLLGVKYLFVSNAAGSLNIDLKPGQLVRISDHINMMGTNPLIGPNVVLNIENTDTTPNSPCERFVSMHDTYDSELGALAHKLAKENNISLKDGVYCAVSGPSFETKAECLMFKGLGADLVGMSTVPEVIAAIHCGLRVLGFSVVTNLSNIFHSEPHSQAEIEESADKAGKNLIQIIKGILKTVNSS